MVRDLAHLNHMIQLEVRNAYDNNVRSLTGMVLRSSMCGWFTSFMLRFTDIALIDPRIELFGVVTVMGVAFINEVRMKNIEIAQKDNFQINYGYKHIKMDVDRLLQQQSIQASNLSKHRDSLMEMVKNEKESVFHEMCVLRAMTKMVDQDTKEFADNDVYGYSNMDIKTDAEKAKQLWTRLYTSLNQKRADKF